MGLYQGRALREGPPRPRPTRARRVRRALQMLGLLALLAGLAHVPWDAWRRKLAVISVVEVRGAEYLDPGRVSELAGIRTGGDLLGLDFDRARQELLRHARIADARVTRRGLTGVSIRIVERRPALLVRHGVPWELDSAGVLLKPFADGAVAEAFPSNPNGAEAAVAGLCNARGNVLALMPHPERAVELGQLSRAMGGEWGARRDRAQEAADDSAFGEGPGMVVFRELARHLEGA